MLILANVMCILEQVWLRFSQQDSENRSFSGVWIAREAIGSPVSGWQMTFQFTASFNDLL